MMSISLPVPLSIYIKLFTLNEVIFVTLTYIYFTLAEKVTVWSPIVNSIFIKLVIMTLNLIHCCTLIIPWKWGYVLWPLTLVTGSQARLSVHSFSQLYRFPRYLNIKMCNFIVSDTLMRILKWILFGDLDLCLIHMFDFFRVHQELFPLAKWKLQIIQWINCYQSIKKM